MSEGRDPDHVLSQFADVSERATRPKQLALAKTSRIGRLTATGVALVVLIAMGTLLWLGPWRAQDSASLPSGLGASPAGGLVEWTLDSGADVSSEARVIHIYAFQKSCDLEPIAVGRLTSTVAYGPDSITIELREMPPFDISKCDRLPTTFHVPWTIELQEPIGQRALRDAVFSPSIIRWRPPRPGEFALLTPPRIGSFIREQGVPIIFACPGVGLEGVRIAGDPSDPRLVWLEDERGDIHPSELRWPVGYTARFTPDLEVLDERGFVVWREGDQPTGACVAGDHYLMLEPGRDP